MGINFKRLKSDIDVDALNAALIEHKDLWDQFTQRQDLEGSPHSETKTIFVRWCANQSVDAAFNEIPAINYPAFTDLPAVWPLIKKIEEAVGSKSLGRVLIVKMVGNSKIDRHADEGAYSDHYERFHLVLESNGEVYFSVDGVDGVVEYVNMKKGELWWFNHKQPHWVYNYSNEDRIHLILDCVAPRYRTERV